MTTMRELKPERPAGARVHCVSVVEHLDRRDYQRAADLLREAKVVCGRTGDAMTLYILNAAQRICVACKNSRDEAEWYGRAYAEVLEREQEFSRELRIILSLLDDPGHRELSQKHASTDNPKEAVGSIPVSRGGLWNRLQKLLHGADHTRRSSPDESLFRATASGSMEKSGRNHEGIECLPDEAAGNETASTARDAPPSLAVCCLGTFQVYLNDQLVGDWRNGKAKSVFKYLIAHHDRPVPKELLMELFWPDANPDHARNSLNVTIYQIRQTLSTDPSFSHVLFQNNCYLLNPELQVWVDVESFYEHIALARALERRGDQEAAIRNYCVADALYAGPYLEEDRYEDWITSKRQALESDYLKLLNRLKRYYFELEDYDKCVSVCNKILAIDSCDEEAHRQLIQCHLRQDEPNLAIRQYYSCVAALERELGVAPNPQTVALGQQIRTRGSVPECGA